MVVARAGGDELAPKNVGVGGRVPHLDAVVDREIVVELQRAVGAQVGDLHTACVVDEAEVSVARAQLEKPGKADLVLAMTAGHVQAAITLAGGEHRDKIVRLDPDADIEDPIGLDGSAYDALADRLAEIIPPRLKELLKTT